MISLVIVIAFNVMSIIFNSIITNLLLIWRYINFVGSMPINIFIITPQCHIPYLPVSTLNTIHHNRLTVCLPDSLDLEPLPIDFFGLSWFTLAFVGALEIWSLRLRLRRR